MAKAKTSKQTGLEVEVIGGDGNVFMVMGKVSKAMKRADFRDEAKEMLNRVKSEAIDYDDALNIMQKYVKFE